MFDGQLLRNFKLQFPKVSERMTTYERYNETELIVCLDDNSIILYDDLSGTIRNLPKDSCNMSEEEFRLEFSSRLRKMIDIRGITQSKLAQRIGISNVMLSRYVCGTNTPTFYMADKIAKALDCSLDDLRYV